MKETEQINKLMPHPKRSLAVRNKIIIVLSLFGVVCWLFEEYFCDGYSQTTFVRFKDASYNTIPDKIFILSEIQFFAI